MSVHLGDKVRALNDILSDEDGQVFARRGEVLTVCEIQEGTRYPIKVTRDENWSPFFGVETYEIEVEV